MTDTTRRDELLEQCLRRVKNYRTQHGQVWSEQYQVKLAEEVAGIIRGTLARKPNRITGEAGSAVQADVPAKYVDDVIGYHQAEFSRVGRLKEKGDPLWLDLVGPIESYARRWLADHYLPGFYSISFDHLVLEIVSQTFVRVKDSEFEGYCYDCPLNAWVANFAHHVGQELLGDHIKYQQKIQPLETVLPGMDEVEVGDTISDPAVQIQLDQMMARLVIEQALPALSSDQAEVIRLMLDHQSVEEIAYAMSRSPKAIYSLKERAVVSMRRYLKLTGEF
jgi:DNA-directed RNA polymerase specialized sigma24 family protein